MFLGKFVLDRSLNDLLLFQMGFPGNSINDLALETEDLNDDETEEENEDNDSAIGEDEGIST